MIAERWRQMESMFQSALGRDPTERDSYLEQACGGDEELCREMRALLAGHHDCEFLEDNAVTLALHAIEKRAAFEPGQNIGPYRIEALLATGGMGLVYRAFDTRLQRPVALKVLRLGLLGEQARAILKREAQSIAQLQHPNICALYDVGEQDGREYLVMEYLPGGTLADRLKRAPLNLAQALEYATQIAAALEQAHKHKITHRDLKPGNVIITKTGAKLLDFGLAAVRPDREATWNGIAADITLTGKIAGTPRYMAPEQMRGELADARSDIFAFGLVLYEMLAGRYAFPEPRRAEQGGSAVPLVPLALPGIPPPLQRVLNICFAEDPDDRWQSAGDLKRELMWISGTVSEATRPDRRAWLVAAFVCIALCVGASGWAGYRLHSMPPTSSVRFSLDPPPGATYQSYLELALSPNGEQLVFSALTSDGKTMLWLRYLNELTARVLPGTEDARYPFWSPDSRYLAFSTKDGLFRVDPSGTTVQKIWSGSNISGGAWGPNDKVLFSPAPFSTLHWVSASGGVPVAVTEFDKAFEDVRHISPSFLPDGRHFLFSALGSRHPGMLYVGSLDSKKARLILKTPSRAHYRNGRLYFLETGRLHSQAFDLKSLKLTGEPVTVAESVSTFDLSQTGTLVYRTANTAQPRLVWLNQNGKQLSKPFGQGLIVAAAVSPDGNRVATVLGPRSAVKVSVVKLPSLEATPLTKNAALDAYPAWSPDGKQISYSSNRSGNQNIYLRTLDSPNSEEAIVPSKTEKVAQCWSPDRRYLSLTERVGTLFQIWIVPLAEPHKQFCFLESKFSKSMGQFSPDGKWMAYWSDQLGRSEIFVADFPSGALQHRVSFDGGAYPQWRPDGKEIYYVNHKSKLIAVPISLHDAKADLGHPRPLADLAGSWVGPPYSITRGGRLLALIDPGTSLPRPIVVVTNTAGSQKTF